MVEVLAALSASAAAGIRIALPLLLIGLWQNDLWSKVPLLSNISPQIVVGVLVSWSLFEIFASKRLLGQRILNLIQLLFSPIVGAIMSMAIAKATHLEDWLTIVMGVVGGLLALVLQLVQVGWFYRWRGLPLWMLLVQDVLCICLVIFAFDAPQQGGLIALLLLWLAIRSYQDWYRCYKGL
ncbi:MULTISPECIES: DUF4126 domain-containing protein [Okeania]|uniref:DUF4126 domain-containing protein n=1 Tax=Okeania hirsuta TaxID=1458930 RepID=A0A3N6NX26_9CYAN|nr:MULTISPECIES: DUF4126 domain-containing protein [Okeania]NEP05040.1 DUF4126 domain-containing protein [Okeania sp. SIO4D6]NEP45681.1 DUF4126 domain-containing protein [Okeania sp. SIO2H7]NEP75298.1 DUF4126 domain-containing protein [Okeania sp. SIO2G5]NEP96050.1 DUF4126 domain-containing protein [Okeania sp. SIO2F5]NEQ91983.1 DUF4126 domain-containing protein [Okeania sp. SIO2G4]